MRVRWGRVFFVFSLFAVIASIVWLRHNAGRECETIYDVHDALVDDYQELLDILDEYENLPEADSPGFWDEYGRMVLIAMTLAFIITLCPLAMLLLALVVRRFISG